MFDKIENFKVYLEQTRFIWNRMVKKMEKKIVLSFLNLFFYY